MDPKLKELLDMKIGERTYHNEKNKSFFYIYRVPGGWIYEKVMQTNTGIEFAVFVPEPVPPKEVITRSNREFSLMGYKEGQEDKKKKKR